MQTVQTWCRKYRPPLAAWLTLEGFQAFMDVVEEATALITGGKNWSEQTAFLQSEAGAEYYRRFAEQFARIAPRAGSNQTTS